MPEYQPFLDQLNQKAESVAERDRELAKRERELGAEKTERDTKNNYHALCDDLESWLRKIPVLGFHSQKYDIPMIQSPLIRLLISVSGGNDDLDAGDTSDIALDDLVPDIGNLDEYLHGTGDLEAELDNLSEIFAAAPKTTANVRFTKKNNAFMAIETDKLKILDISNYLSPTSYSQYLKAFHVEEKKGFFPYEYITDFEQLKETSLPPYESFHSALNGKNSLDGEGGEAEGRAQWAELQNLWRDLGMANILDLLRWYNNLDVTAFVTAVNRQFALFREHLGVDIFKDGISLPGISLKYAMKTTDANFALYGQKYKWLHKDLREAITGGPSIIFSRHQEKGVTKIRGLELGDQAEMCESVVGVDANSLYLWSFAQDFPAGNFEVRHGPDFKREKQPRHGYSAAAIRWIESEAEKRGVKISHTLNSNGEIAIGARKLRVDGFLASENAIFEFHGCYYHACATCQAHRPDELHPYGQGKTFAEVREFTREKMSYLGQLGYTVYEKWECEWLEDNPPTHPPPRHDTLSAR